MNTTLAIIILQAVTLVGLAAALVFVGRTLKELEEITESLFHTAMSLRVTATKAERHFSKITHTNKQAVDVKRKPLGGFIIIEKPLDFPNDHDEDEDE